MIYEWNHQTVLSTLTLLQSKDTKAVAPSGKRPRGRPRKFHSVEEQKSSVHASGVNHGASGVAPAVDHGGGGDGDRGVGKVKGTSKEEDLLKDILLGNSSDNQESGQVSSPGYIGLCI